MKTKIIGLLILFVVISFCVLAGVSRNYREASFNVVPNANMNSSKIRISGAELLLNRRAIFTVELINTNNIIIDRVSVLLIKSELKQWFNSTNPTVTLKQLITSKLTVTSDETETIAETAE